MFCVRNRTYCDVCKKIYIVIIYPNHTKSQGHINNALKDHCTTSTKKKYLLSRNK